MVEIFGAMLDWETRRRAKARSLYPDWSARRAFETTEMVTRSKTHLPEQQAALIPVLVLMLGDDVPEKEAKELNIERDGNTTHFPPDACKQLTERVKALDRAKWLAAFKKIQEDRLADFSSFENDPDIALRCIENVIKAFVQAVEGNYGFSISSVPLNSSAGRPLMIVEEPDIISRK